MLIENMLFSKSFENRTSSTPY